MEYTARIIGFNDWATWLFIGCFILIAVSKFVFESRFSDFVKLAYSDKYIKLYKEEKLSYNGLGGLLMPVRLISYSFFFQIVGSALGFFEKYNTIQFLQIATFVFTYVICKNLIEKILATIFNIEEFNNQFSFSKSSYLSYIGMYLFPISVILFYNDNIGRNLIISIFLVFLLSNLYIYLLSLRNYQKLVLRKLFYFILYLCCLEIAPYFLFYYWFTKS